MHDGEENITIGALMEGVYALFRSRDDYESVSETEHDLVARIQYASAVVQAEKVTARRVGSIRSLGRAKKGRRSGGRGSAAWKRSGERARRPLACPMARGRGSGSPRRRCRLRR